MTMPDFRSWGPTIGNPEQRPLVSLAGFLGYGLHLSYTAVFDTMYPNMEPTENAVYWLRQAFLDTVDNAKIWYETSQLAGQLAGIEFYSGDHVPDVSIPFRDDPDKSMDFAWELVSYEGRQPRHNGSHMLMRLTVCDCRIRKSHSMMLHRAAFHLSFWDRIMSRARVANTVGLQPEQLLPIVPAKRRRLLRRPS